MFLICFLHCTSGFTCDYTRFLPLKSNCGKNCCDSSKTATFHSIWESDKQTSPSCSETLLGVFCLVTQEKQSRAVLAKKDHVPPILYTNIWWKSNSEARFWVKASLFLIKNIWKAKCTIYLNTQEIDGYDGDSSINDWPPNGWKMKILQMDLWLTVAPNGWESMEKY